MVAAKVVRPNYIGEHHWQEWLASAVDPEIIARNVRSLHDAFEVDRTLNRNSKSRWKHSSELVPCWQVTGLDPLLWERTLLGVQVKPDHPPVNAEGSPQKYLGATGYDGAPLFLETGLDDYWEGVLRDKSIPIILTEGAKKAGAGLTLGYATISIPGVSTCRKDGRLHRWLEVFAGFGRKFYLCFDSDIMHKKSVQYALLGMARELAATGSKVMVVELPPDRGKGMDDFIVGNGKEEFDKLIADAKTIEEWRKTLDGLWQQNADPDRPLSRSKTKQMMNLLGVEWGRRLRFNTMTLKPELDGEPLDLDTLAIHIAEELDIDIGNERACQIVLRLAKKNSYSPVQEYLERVAANYPEAESILDNIATRYFGTNEPLHNTFMRKHLIGQVRRVFEPGCQHDTVVVLQGDQGIKKSSFWRTLAVDPDWFDDTIATGSSDKDERLKLRRFWILELAEIESVFRRKEVASLRGFLTTKCDNLRVPYGRSVESFARTSCFVGSVNPKQFLVDPEGHRRFWVIPVAVDRIPTEKLVEERDRIWAAAVQAYRCGEQNYLTSVDEKRNALLNKRYEVEDSWQEVIDFYLENVAETSVSDILTNCLKIEVGRHDRALQMRVAECLKRLDWVKCEKKKISGKVIQVWRSQPINEGWQPGSNQVATKVATNSNLDTASTSDKRLLPLPPFDEISQQNELVEVDDFKNRSQGSNGSNQTPETQSRQELDPVATSVDTRLPPHQNSVATSSNLVDTFAPGDEVEYLGTNEPKLRGKQLQVTVINSDGVWLKDKKTGFPLTCVSMGDLRKRPS